jgi:hypothetical protein
MRLTVLHALLDSSIIKYLLIYLLVSNLKADIRDGIFKLLRSPGIDSKEPILPAYVAWQAGTTTLFLLGS